MPRGFTEREKDVINHRLLEVGLQQFSQLGLKKTSVDELAAAAGISKGAFYLFYEGKEALFMEVIEKVEERFRGQILAAVDAPGPTTRARLYAVLSEVIRQLRTIPILRSVTIGEYDLVFRSLPEETLREHFAADQVFLKALIERCREAGILIQIDEAELRSLFYGVVLAVLHDQEFGQDPIGSSVDTLIELICAYAIGEVTLQVAHPNPPAVVSEGEP